MAGNIKGITVEIGGDTKGLKSAINSVNKEAKSLQKELRGIESLLKLDPHNVELLAQKQEVLTQAVAETTQKLKQLEAVKQQVEASGQDLNTEEYRYLIREIEKTKRELTELESAATSTKADLSKLGAEVKDTGRDFSKLASQANEAGSKMKSVGSSMTGISAGIAAGFVGAVEGTEELRRDLSRLEVNAQSAGVSMDFMAERLAYAEAVTGETDSSIEALSNLLASGFDATNMQLALEGLAGAAIKFSDTLKLEGLADGLQETLATGSAIGPFAEMLERSGVSLETFDAGLAEAKANGTELNYVIEQMANAGLVEVSAEWRENNKNLVENAEATSRLRSALAELGNTLTPIMTALTNFATKVVTAFNNLPTPIQNFAIAIAGIVAVIAPLLSMVGFMLTNIGALAGIFGTLAGVATKVVGGIKAIGTAITVATGPVGWIVLGITAVVTAIVLLWKNCEGFRNFFTQLWDGLKMVVQVFVNAVKTNFTNLVNAIKNVWNSIPSFFTNLFNKIKNAVMTVANGIKTAFTTAVNAVKSVWGAITGFFQNIVAKIVGVFQSLPSKMASIGRNIVQGIINGVTGAASRLFTTLRNLANKALNAAKNALGIHSPSRVMRDVVGKNIALGIAEGVEQNTGAVTEAMKKVSQDILTEAESILEKQKKYGEISAEQELQYWKEVKNIHGLQGEEILAIDEKIFEQEKALMAQAEQAYEQRVNELISFAGIFSEFENKTVSGKDLMSGLASQVDALEEYGNLMAKLTERGISAALIEELRKQGVGAVNEIRALAKMSDKELAKYDALYGEKLQLAAEQAALEIGGATTGIVDNLNQAVTALNTNASLVVNQASAEQATLLDQISTKASEYVGQALLDGLTAIQQTILEAMPDYLQINIDGTQVARTTWNPFVKEGDRRNRIYAPSRQQIAEIAAQVHLAMSGSTT